MSEYTPNSWVVLKFEHKGKPIYKVLAGWGGGYLYGASWKLNSGITEVKEDGDYLLFSGYSGSVYRCHKDGYGMHGMMHGVYNSFLEQVKDNPDVTMHLFEEDTDFIGMNYGATDTNDVSV